MKKKLLSGNNVIAWLWGAAEATFFFIVPDVFLSYLALDGYKKALIACVYVLAGALAGGLFMYTISYNKTEVTALLDMVPGISPSLIQHGQVLFDRHMLYGMLEGSFSGVPYKIFSAHAGSTSAPIILFILASAAARFPRFIAISLLTAIITQTLLKNKTSVVKKRILIAVWTLFYICYFYNMGW